MVKGAASERGKWDNNKLGEQWGTGQFFRRMSHSFLYACSSWIHAHRCP